MSDALPVTEQTIAARLERLPYSSWHITITAILGVAIFFNSFELARHRLCAAGAGARLAHRAAQHRSSHQQREFRPGHGRADVRLDRRAHRAGKHGAHRHRDIRCHEFRMRFDQQLRPAHRLPFHPGHRARRRNSRRVDLYQRDPARRPPRRPLSDLSDHFSGRIVDVRRRRRVGGAALRLAMDVHSRRGTGGSWRW